METYKQLAAGRDVMVLEGGRSWREGYVAGLSPRRFVELVQAQALIVLRYDQTLADRSLAARRATRSTSPPARAWLSASATRPFWPYHSLADGATGETRRSAVRSRLRNKSAKR